jgi:hypothetical protein
MKETLYLRIITAILLPGIEQRIGNKYPRSTMALSQVSPVNINKREIPSSVIEVERLTLILFMMKNRYSGQEKPQWRKYCLYTATV